MRTNDLATKADVFLLCRTSLKLVKENGKEAKEKIIKIMMVKNLINIIQPVF